MSTRPTRRAAAKRKQIIEEDSDDEINASPSPSPEEEEDSEEEFTPAPKSRKSVGPPARSRRQTTQPPAQIDTPPTGSSAGRRPGRPRKSARDTSTAPTESSLLNPDRASTPTATAATTTRKRGRPKKNVIKEESVEAEAMIAVAAPEPEKVQDTVEATTTTQAHDDDEQDENAEPKDDEGGDAMDVDEVEEQEPVKKSPGTKRKSVAPPAAAAKSPTPAREQLLQVPSPATGSMATPKATATPTPEAERFQTPLADITEAVGNDQRRAIEDTVLLNTVKPVKPMETVMDRPMDIVLKSRTMALPQVEDTTPKPRLVITYLILNNFKSYAGRQEVGPFHASFSSVVGPNGSGKSNVIDSLLFVFGFRASKMRQGKLSALIHNSAEHPNLDFCEVAVHFHEVMDQVIIFSSSICPIFTKLSHPARW